MLRSGYQDRRHIDGRFGYCLLVELRGLEPADALVAEQPAPVRTEQGPLDRLIMRLEAVVDRHVADPTAALAYEQSAQDADMSDALGTLIRRLAVLLHRTDGPA